MRIKELRKENKISQLQLAKLLNTTQANISSWEKEKWQPDTDNIIKMASFFNCSVDYLLGLDNEMQKKQPEIIEPLLEQPNEDKRECFELINKLSEKQLKYTKIYLQTLLGEEIEKIKKDYKGE